MAGTFVLYLCVSLAAYDAYIFGRDLAIADQATRGWASLQWPISDVLAPGANALGEHFSLTFALLAPLYWIWSDPRMLVGAQAMLIAVSVWPVWDFAQRRLGRRSALVVAVVYALGWELQSLAAFDVHEVALAVPLVAVVVNALDRDDDRTLLLACFGLLLAREDMGLFLIAVAAVLAVRRRFRLAALLAAIGSAAFAVLTFVVVPAFAWDRAYHFWTLDQLGPDPRSALVNVLRRPWILGQTAVTPEEKVRSLQLLLLPTAFLSVFSIYFVLALPFLAEQLLSSRPIVWRPALHYWAVIAPIVIMAAVDSVARFSGRFSNATLLRRLWLAWTVLFAIVGTLLLPTSYSSLPIVMTARWQANAAADMDTAVDAVPRGVCVEADDRALPHLSPDRRAFGLVESQGLATWAVVDVSRASGSTGVRPASYASALVRDGWTMEKRAGSIVVLRRTQTSPSPCPPP